MLSLAGGECNAAFRAFTGSGAAWRESVHPDDRARMDAALAGVEASGARIRAEARLRHCDGGWQSMAVDGARLDAGTYALTWREKTATEISDLVAHERILTHREDMQRAVADLGRAILHGVPDACAEACRVVTGMLDAAFTVVVEIDRKRDEVAIAALHGPLQAKAGTRVPLEKAGHTVWTCSSEGVVISADLLAERRFLPWQTVLDSGARSAISVSIPGDASPYGMLVAYGWTVREYSPSEAGFLESVAHLLTAAIYRRRADLEMATQRQELEALVNHAPDLISRYAPDTTILFVNDIARLGGWDPRQLIGRRITEIGLAPPVERAWVDGISEAFRTGVPLGFETESKNGQYVLDVRLVPELDAGGRVVQVMAISRDITERRRAEEERSRLQEELEQARRAASVSRLGATVAHEFNNVLMSISPFAEIIARTSREDARLQKAASYILKAIARGRRVTHDIMRFTRPADPSPRRIDLAAWLPGVVKTTMQQFSGIPVAVNAPTEPLYADVDPQQLDQAVANLLLNARDALVSRGTGGIRVTLSSHEKRIRLAVEDDGGGIVPENLDKVFEPFFTTKRSGTGLGLPVVRQIVERHGGTIAVESRGTDGSTFIVTLPAAAAQVAGEAAAVEQTIDGRNLLLVEDEEAVADGLAALLQAGGASVRVAPTAKAALTALEEETPEAVLLDVGLPDLDGVDLFAVVRHRWPALPIIFSTGHGDQARLDELLRLPHVGHLVKPFDLDELTVAVAHAIAE